MIVLSFGDIRTEGVLLSHWDALVRVLAALEIRVGGRLWYSEPHDSLIELADAFAPWLRQARPGTFSSSSLDSAEPWLIRFVDVGSGVWKLEALGQEFADAALHPTREVQSADSNSWPL